jgi:uncharacterized membrane protein
MSNKANPQVARSGDTDSAAPPQSKLLVFVFPDDAKIDQAIGAVITKLTAKEYLSVYRLAVVSRDLDGKISVKDITEKDFGTIGVGAFIGGLAGLAAGPLGAAIGAGAGALFGWSAELVNEEAVSEFANKCLSGLAAGGRAIVAEVAEEAAPSFESLMQENGGTVCNRKSSAAGQSHDPPR